LVVNHRYYFSFLHGKAALQNLIEDAVGLTNCLIQTAPQD
jgi:hypothetical protein